MAENPIEKWTKYRPTVKDYLSKEGRRRRALHVAATKANAEFKVQGAVDGLIILKRAGSSVDQTEQALTERSEEQMPKTMSASEVFFNLLGDDILEKE